VTEERLELSIRLRHWFLKPACIPFHHSAMLVRQEGVEPSTLFREQLLRLPCIPFHH
jgi:hypothetical protein